MKHNFPIQGRLLNGASMRILLLTMYFAPDQAANSVVMTGLVEALLASGHDVTVLTTFPHYDTNRIWPEYRRKLVQRSTYKEAKVYRTYLYVPQNKASIFGRLLNYISFNLLSTVIALLQTRHDVIMAPSPPLTIGLSAWLVGSLRRTPFIYNVQDIYPDIAIRLGVLTNPRMVRFFKWMETFVYHKAAAVSVLSEGFRQNLLAKQVPDEKLHVIPNFIDVNFIRPLPKDNDFSRQQNLHGKFVVMYAGNIGMSQKLESLIDAAELLQTQTDIHFLIVGNGVAKNDLIAHAAEKELENVIFLPFQPHERVPEMYATADISVVCLRGDIGNESVPSKAYTILASGRPLLASVAPDAETRLLIEQADCGVWVPAENPTSLVEAIYMLYNNPTQRTQLGYNGRRFVEQHCTPDVIARQYVELFLSLA